MELEEIQESFPLGTEIKFTWDCDYEPGQEIELVGIVKEHTPSYYGLSLRTTQLLGYFTMQVYNRKDGKYYKVHYKSAKLSRAQILNDLLNEEI